MKAVLEARLDTKIWHGNNYTKNSVLGFNSDSHKALIRIAREFAKVCKVPAHSQLNYIPIHSL